MPKRTLRRLKELHAKAFLIYVVLPLSSPYAEDCHNIAAEIQNTFAKNVVTIEDLPCRLSPWLESLLRYNYAF